jgi:hypothetical protein
VLVLVVHTVAALPWPLVRLLRRQRRVTRGHPPLVVWDV